MIPLYDLNPTRRFPIATYGLIALNVLVFLWELSFSESGLNRMFLEWSVVPRNIGNAPLGETFLDIVRSMFFHGGWSHLFGNMLYLYLFGDNIEDRLGIPLYLFLYFASGFVAAFAQFFTDPSSPIPLVGASGAISGVLGAYLVIFPRIEVRGIIPLGFYFHSVRWPAFVVLGMWFVLQLFYAVFSIGNTEGGVAFFAHVGGFVAGMILMWLFMWVVPQPPSDQRYQTLYRRAQRYPY